MSGASESKRLTLFTGGPQLPELDARFTFGSTTMRGWTLNEQVQMLGAGGFSGMDPGTCEIWLTMS